MMYVHIALLAVFIVMVFIVMVFIVMVFIVMVYLRRREQWNVYISTCSCVHMIIILLPFMCS